MRDVGDSNARHVLIESGDPVAAAAQARSLRRAGFRVAVCGGPATLAEGRCPGVEWDSCPLAAGADVILYDLELDDPADRAVLAALRVRWPDIPVVARIPPAISTRYQHMLRGCIVRPADMDRLVAVVAAAAGDQTAWSG